VASSVEDAGNTYISLTYSCDLTVVETEIVVTVASDVLFANPLVLEVYGTEDQGDGTELVTLRTLTPVEPGTQGYFSTVVVTP